MASDWSFATSNIVWAQGSYDLWKGGGVSESLSESLLAIVIPGAAHHVDLFFSDPGDTDVIKEERLTEMARVREWTEEKRDINKRAGL